MEGVVSDGVAFVMDKESWTFGVLDGLLPAHSEPGISRRIVVGDCARDDMATTGCGAQIAQAGEAPLPAK